MTRLLAHLMVRPSLLEPKSHWRIHPLSTLVLAVVLLNPSIAFSQAIDFGSPARPVQGGASQSVGDWFDMYPDPAFSGDQPLSIPRSRQLPAAAPPTAASSVAQPTSATPSLRDRSSLLSRLSRFDSITQRHPQLFADSPSAPLTLRVSDGLVASSDLPLAGGARRLKVAANNRALPQDRLIIDYQRFYNALSADASHFIVEPARRDMHLDQLTIGMERTFADELLSLDVRMPFTNDLVLDTPNFGVQGGTVGNLNMKLKALLLQSGGSAFSGGLGLELPTGSDVVFQGNGIYYRVENSAYFLQPFLAYENTSNTWFCNGFTSIDIPLGGNRFRYDDIDGSTIDRIHEQTLMTFSAGVGRWLFRTNQRPLISGVALVSEIHYATTLEGRDSVSDSYLFQSTVVTSAANHFNHLNATVGTHIDLGRSALRIGYVQPLRGGTDRVFDNELVLQYNWFL